MSTKDSRIAALAKAGLSQATLSRYFGVSTSRICQILKEHRNGGIPDGRQHPMHYAAIRMDAAVYGRIQDAATKRDLEPDALLCLIIEAVAVDQLFDAILEHTDE